jgi:hypothetical protein
MAENNHSSVTAVEERLDQKSANKRIRGNPAKKSENGKIRPHDYWL